MTYDTFDDLIKTKPKIICKNCGSDNTKVSHKMSTGIVYKHKDMVYKRYKQFIKCNNCNKAYIVFTDEVLIDESPEDVINIIRK